MLFSVSLISMFLLHAIAVVVRTNAFSPGDDGVPDALKKLLARDYCHVELRSWGYDDTSRVGYAKVNGRIEVDYDRPGHNEQVRGFNLNLLRRSDCRTTESKHFDTWETNQVTENLVTYLRNLANGSVLYGATCDEATKALTPVARQTLLDIGVDVTDLVERGKLTFVAVIGRPLSTVFRIAGPGGDNLFMEALVIKTIEDPLVTLLEQTKDTTKHTTANAYWFPIAVSSLVLNAVAVIVTTLVIIYAKKRIAGTRLRSDEVKAATEEASQKSQKYTSLNHRVKCEGSVYKESSFYEEIPSQKQVSSLDVPTITVSNRPAMPQPADYLHLIDD